MYYRGQNEYSQRDSKSLLRNIIIVIGCLCLLLFIIDLTTTGSNPEKYTEIRVENGQSLWTIAAKYYNNDCDIRKKIYDIKKINNLEDALLQPGQKLKIPEKEL